MSALNENERSFFYRFYRYQSERFPIIVHGIMISTFTFSAISYSRICRGIEGFIDFNDFIIGVFATITLFLLVRIFDEFKDHEDDIKFRQYLPVPRGLVTLNELKIIAIAITVIQVSVILLFQAKMFYLYILVLAYLCLMGVEFFASVWLKKHQLAYITSHMFIIPLIDIYASGLDWLLGGAEAHYGILWFFAVSYFNGLVLEFGRKLRTAESEEKGVVSYTKLYGKKGGVIIWIILLFVTMCLAIAAADYANYSDVSTYIFGAFFIVFSLPAWSQLKRESIKKTKLIEYSSAAWTALMYLSLGGIPMVKAIL